MNLGGRDTPMEPDSKTMLSMYEVMATIRQCEDRIRTLVMSGQIQLVTHGPRNQEAIAAGVGAAMSVDDRVVTTYRGMHDHVAKGVPLRKLWAEYLGRVDGACGGRGGPMHITDVEHGLMMTTGIVGGGITIANGFAIEAQIRGSGRVTVCNFGDGASNIGAFHEGLNLAQLWKLPIVFVCQNNLYAEHTAVVDHQANEHIADRAVAYGMRGVTVDGHDPVVVRAEALEALGRARDGAGPTLLEAVVYRGAGHYIGDAMDYVPAEWAAQAKAADPVAAFRARLVAGGHSEEDLQAMEKQIESALDDAVEFAKASPYPDEADLCRNVYAEGAVR